MKKLLFLFFLFPFLGAQTQVVETPDKTWGDLFKAVQLAHVFADNKTFVDAVPKEAPAQILKEYAQEKKERRFNLKSFVSAHFILPQTDSVRITKGLPIEQHIEQLWSVLTRKADTQTAYSSLLALPHPYIVPGGRFREIYYWDSYFTMQGLAVSRRFDLIENMIDNFSWLIQTYGHIPNGNRSYYLSRSQPPYFALMVELLHEHKGDSVYQKYYASLQKEYGWWMQGTENLQTQNVYRRLVKMRDGAVLNRYWDDTNAPRQESYAEDVTTAKEYAFADSLAYRNLRAGAESGWDFSSRWLADTFHLRTIETTNIVPVDLNRLLYQYEMILSRAAQAAGDTINKIYYRQQADRRKSAIIKYCWSEKDQFFFDYDVATQQTTGRWSIAGATPLFAGLASPEQAIGVQKNIETKFLKDGGVVTTPYHTGQQWDAPNGWAPLQLITVVGLQNYHYDSLAKKIAQRWMAVNERVYNSTGKLLEKYNVEDIHLISGGGEYPTQDGFGWTNGVYLKLRSLFQKE